ncbi:hypothetical protein GCM10010521_55590 [Streptomyces rameus]|uniref:OmpR/PhoB-type domain-containing protein n=1 Tax=Streptomyces rameus TaxID=68261 RepID=A0ABN3UZ40_9ACTN
MSIGFTFLGNVTIHSRGVAVTAGSPRQRCVLALLLIDVNRPVSAQTLLTRVWGDDVPPRAMTSLYSYVSRLRALRSDPGDAERWDILRTPAGYVLRTDSSAVDLFRFRSLVERARGATDPREAEASYSQALALWRGEPFAGLRSAWLDAYRLTLAEEHLRARLDHYELLLNRGRHVDLVQPLAALAAEQPLDEHVAHLHMLALYRMGQPAAALTAYEQLRQRLVEQLGVDPGPRLQELHHRILVFDDALAAPAADGVERRTPHQLPASPSGFIGRREALRLLDTPEGRADGAAPDVSVIAGMAGVGKSWLALRWAHQHADEFPDGQLYAQLNGFSPSARPTDPGDVLRLFLMALGATESELPSDTEGRAALYRTVMAGRKILVVLDNARDSAQVVPLLPGTPGCRTLVTSRNRLSSLKVRAGADVVGLGVLPAGESARLFTRRVGDDRAAEPALRDIVRWCAGLPLALDIAAAHADGLPCASLDQLAQDLRDPSTRLDVLDAGDVSASLRVLFAASHAALDPEPGRVFGLLGLVPHQDVSLDALAHFIERDPTRTRRIMRVLEEACLIRQHRPGRYQMHDLVRLYVEEQATGLTAGQSDRHTRRLVGFYVCTAQVAHRVLEPHRTAQDPPALEVPEEPPRLRRRAGRAGLVRRRVRLPPGGRHHHRTAGPVAGFLPSDLGSAHVPLASRSVRGKHPCLVHRPGRGRGPGRRVPDGPHPSAARGRPGAGGPLRRGPAPPRRGSRTVPRGRRTRGPHSHAPLARRGPRPHQRLRTCPSALRAGAGGIPRTRRAGGGVQHPERHRLGVGAARPVRERRGALPPGAAVAPGP